MPLIQVFEHELVRAGEERGGAVLTAARLAALAAWETPYFTVLHGAVRFSHYVGVMQVGDLTIEVLPKADREGPAAKWQGVLIELLCECRLLPRQALPPAGQALRRHALLDLYIDLFLDELAALLRQGLLRAYRRERSDVGALRGRLLVAPHIRRNSGRVDRFHTEHDSHDYRHRFNSMLWGAMDVLRRLPLSSGQLDRLGQCRLHFPAGVTSSGVVPDWEAITFSRHTERYRPALQLAWLLLRHYQPALRGGAFPSLALMFDMNSLFEEFVYRQLLGAAAPGEELQRQARRPFWDRTHLRPDIVLRRPAGRVVIDTKWKAPRRPQPEAGDLQQLFAYLHYFQARQGVLIYPRTGDLPPAVSGPFHPAAGAAGLSCRLLFVDVLDEAGQLNRRLGREIMGRLTVDG